VDLAIFTTGGTSDKASEAPAFGNWDGATLW
jgi:hypothetical protein